MSSLKDEAANRPHYTCRAADQDARRRHWVSAKPRFHTI